MEHVWDATWLSNRSVDTDWRYNKPWNGSHAEVKVVRVKSQFTRCDRDALNMRTNARKKTPFSHLVHRWQLYYLCGCDHLKCITIYILTITWGHSGRGRNCFSNQFIQLTIDKLKNVFPSTHSLSPSLFLSLDFTLWLSRTHWIMSCKWLISYLTILCISMR